jgi:glycosyltransferase involved in cell wall biosynthesis
MVKDKRGIAVIIPLFNGEKYVQKTIRSVFRQTLVPKETIVVDDGSTDLSTSIIRGYCQVQLFQNPNNGPNAARNHGFSETDAETVAFLDQDDLWHPEHLERLSQSLEKHPESPAACACKTTFQEGEIPDYEVTPGSSLLDPWAHYPKNAIGEPFLALVRREALESVEGWSTRYDGCADYHLWLKLGLLGPIVKNRCVTAAHRMHEDSFGDDLRSKKVLRYFTRRIEASEDVLDRRRERGLSTQEYEPLLEAHRASKTLLRFLLTGKDRGLSKAARQIDESLSQKPQESTIRIWDILQWYTELYRKRIGVHQFAARVLDLADRWPNTDSRFRRVLREWCVKRLPAKNLIRRYPWSPTCWKKLAHQIYKTRLQPWIQQGARLPSTRNLPD